jgi:hypothetical protein
MTQPKEAAKVLTWLDGGGEIVKGEVGWAVKVIPVWHRCEVIVGVVAT